MKPHRHRLVARLAITVALLLILVGSPAAGARPGLNQPPAPELLVSRIYVGAVPPGAEQNPVLVFVHGYGATAKCWWGPTEFDGMNDMYVTAYNAGYRTAFVSLSGPQGLPANSMWANGLVLSLQLRVIARHYDVGQVEIVAHSKGGVDAQTAIVCFRGWQRVNHLFTLGSPHQGSELADAAYSWWGSWLAELLGFHDAGTYTLQTAYMSSFRDCIDPRAQGQPVTYYSGAGTDTGPEGSILRLLGRYLSRFGESDGLVTVASTALAGSHTLFVEPFHHMNIYMGSTSFPWIHEVLSSPVGVQAPRSGPATGSQMPPAAPQSNSILRGGRLSQAVIEVVPIEPHARTVTFDLLVSDEKVTAGLTGPDGISHSLQTAADDGEGVFGTAPHRVYTVSQPKVGMWRLQISGPPGAAYLLITTIESPLRVALRGLPEGTAPPGESLELSAEANAPLGRPIVRQIETHITRSLPRKGSKRLEVASGQGSTFSWTPSKEGIYVVSATVRGQTARGKDFERSFVRSVAVDFGVPCDALCSQ